MSSKNKREAQERFARANADVLTAEDRDGLRRLVEFILYCQHGSPRTGDVNYIVPFAQRLRKRFDLKMIHYDREHPEED